jgi:hypothetical protein
MIYLLQFTMFLGGFMFLEVMMNVEGVWKGVGA